MLPQKPPPKDNQKKIKKIKKYITIAYIKPAPHLPADPDSAFSSYVSGWQT
jgi:hypothetical protein